MTAAAPLTGKQRRKLRALGHHLSPVVHVGQQGVTPALVAAVEQAIEDHELIKIKVGDAPVDRHEAADLISEATGSAVAQVLGNTVLLFRKREKDSKIDV